MLLAPTDFLWDNARAHRVAARAYGERGIATITPAAAGWAEIYADWKSGGGRIGIKARPESSAGCGRSTIPGTPAST